MAAPSLRIPFNLDQQGFDKSIAEAKSKTAEATKFIVEQFAKTQLRLVVNNDQFKPAVQAATKFVGDEFQKLKPIIQGATQTVVKESTEAALKSTAVLAAPAIKGAFQAFTSVGVPAATGLAQSLAPLAAGALAVYAAFELVSAVVGSVRNQLADLVAIADKAQNFQVSAQFLQQFEGEARKLQVSVEELDGALAHAFQASKEKSPVDISKFELAKERVTDFEFALRVFNDQLAKAAGTQLQGLVLFRDATSQEQRIRAILTAMIELEQIGQRAAALEVGDKFFGTQFVDRIRQGKTSAEEILATMERLKTSQDGLFANELVQRAKEVDDQLKLSEERLSRALKPAWDDIAQVVLTIKGYWADVVDLIARAVEFVNKLGGSSKSAADVAGSVGAAAGGAATPLRSRGTGAAPTLKKTGGSEQRDPFDIAVDNIEKRIATLRADTAATFLNAAAQAQLRAEFQELTALKKSDAGVTQQQIDAYEQYRKTMSASEALVAANIKLTKDQEAAFLNSSHGIRVATEQYQAAQEKLQGLNSASTQVGSALSNAFSDAIVEGRKFGEVLNSLLKTLEKAAINSIFSSIFNAPSGGGLSPILKLFGFADGGFTGAGDRNEPAGIVHRGEFVFDQEAVRRIGVGNLLKLQRGYADGGPVGMPSPADIQTSGSSDGPMVSNVFQVAGDVSQATVDRLRRMIMDTQRGLMRTNQSLASAQRMQAYGVA